MQIRSISGLNFNSKAKKQAVKSIKITPIQKEQVQLNGNQTNAEKTNNAEKKPTFKIYISCSAPKSIALEENRGFLKGFYTPLDPADEEKELPKNSD